MRAQGCAVCSSVPVTAQKAFTVVRSAGTFAVYKIGMAAVQSNRHIPPHHAGRRRKPPSSFVPLLVLALGIHLLAAIANEGFTPSGEYYRYLSFARHGAGLEHKLELPPALAQRTVPGLLPVIGHAVVLGTEAIGVASPFLQSTLLRVLSSLLGLLAALLVFGAFRGECTSHAARRWLFLLLLFLWFMPPLLTRFSAENWSGLLFFLGIAWYYQKGEQGEASMMIAGFLLGLSFFVRFQTVAMLAGFAAWLLVIERADRRVLIGLMGGALIAAVVGSLADRFAYGVWTSSAWNALLAMFNPTAAAAASDHPWWFSARELVSRGFFPIGLVLLMASMGFMIQARRHILTWISLPYLMLHLLLPSPDLRGLFPLVLAMPVMLVLAVQALMDAVPRGRWRATVVTTVRWVGYPLWGVNLALALGASLMPADEYAPMYRFLYDRYGGGSTVLVHAGEDPYARTEVPVACYMPAQLQRIALAETSSLAATLNEHPGARVLLATHRETLPEDIRSEGLQLREIFRRVPEWSALVNTPEWFEPADTVVLYEVRAAARAVKSSYDIGQPLSTQAH